MNKLDIAKISFQFSEHLTESVNELIEGGSLLTEQEVKRYMFECLQEDLIGIAEDEKRLACCTIYYELA